MQQPLSLTAWLTFNIVIALLPLVASALIVILIKLPIHWTWVLRDGELFFFSTAVSATSLGKLTTSLNLQANTTFYSCLLTAIVSATVFGMTSYLKLQRGLDIEEIEKEDSQTSYARLSGASVTFAILSIGLSYSAFFMQ